MPAVSVLMTVWNAGSGRKLAYLHTAVRSILSQSFQDWEFVIVDDGSDDSTPEVLEKLMRADQRIRVVRSERNLHVAGALNMGLEVCRGGYIARMDADDISAVERFDIQKKFLDAHSEFAMCGTGRYLINEEDAVTGEIHYPVNNEEIYRYLRDVGCCFVHGSVMLRRSVLEAVGGYDISHQVRCAEDYDLWIRITDHYRTANIPGLPLYFYRIHNQSISALQLAEQEQAAEFLKKRANALLSKRKLLCS